MIGARFVVLTLLVFVAGGWARWFRSVRAMPRRAQAAVYFATGLVTLTVEMLFLSAIGVRWNALLLLALPAAGLFFALKLPGIRSTGQPRHAVALITVLALIVFASTVLSAAATSGDFVFFWGTKGQRFGAERMLDVEFLRDPDHIVMHPDYPPLVPLYYAWTMLGRTELDWFGAMASSILFLGLATAAVPDRRFAALFASTFALLLIRNDVAGNAEPVLLFFATLALAALVARNDAVAAIALSGAALTKIEGAVFVIIVVAMWVLRDRKWKVPLVPLLTLGAWLLFAKLNGLLDAYVPREELSFRYAFTSFRQLAGEMSFGLWYTPWIAIALLLLVRARIRPALPYLAATAAFLAFMVVIYARPEAHMEWSAERVLLTPLVLFFFAGMEEAPDVI